MIFGKSAKVIKNEESTVFSTNGAGTAQYPRMKNKALLSKAMNKDLTWMSHSPNIKTKVTEF